MIGSKCLGGGGGGGASFQWVGCQSLTKTKQEKIRKICNLDDKFCRYCVNCYHIVFDIHYCTESFTVKLVIFRATFIFALSRVTIRQCEFKHTRIYIVILLFRSRSRIIRECRRSPAGCLLSAQRTCNTLQRQPTK